MIKAVSFDFWGTLFQDVFSKERRIYRAKAILHVSNSKVSLEDAIEALEVAGNEFARCHIEEQRTLTPYDAVEIVATCLGLELDEDKCNFLAEEFATAILVYQPMPVENALDAVKYTAEKVPVGLISDTGISPAKSLRMLLDTYGFTPFISSYSFSDELGVSKPRSIMFEKVADELGVSTSELMHIGDLEPTDIVGIKRLGGIAGLFVGVNSRFEHNTSADYVFRNWDEYIKRISEILD